MDVKWQVSKMSNKDRIPTVNKNSVAHKQLRGCVKNTSL